MHDDGLGPEQARGLRLVLEAAGIGVGALWLHYFRLGGEVGEVEIDAYLHHAFGLPRFERDLLAHAANELIDDRPGRPAPYSSEVLTGDRGDIAGDHGEMATGADGDGDGTDGAAGWQGMEQQ